jgi:hypothetical protein
MVSDALALADRISTSVVLTFSRSIRVWSSSSCVSWSVLVRVLTFSLSDSFLERSDSHSDLRESAADLAPDQSVCA